jgi:LemA protein
VSPAWLAATFALSLVAIVVGFLLVAAYNAVVTLRQRTDKAWSNIDVVLKQRHDQLPALVSAVRGVLAFEHDTLTEVARARSAYSPTEPIPAQAVHSDQTTTAVRSLFAVVERYPELHAQQNVLDLQDEIERLEAMIADRRELYNDQVYRYNARISTMPTMLLTPLFGWRPREFFAATPDEAVPPSTDLP